MVLKRFNAYLKALWRVNGCPCAKWRGQPAFQFGTVSNYLNKSAPVNPQTQLRIQAAIDELGYRRNEIASSLRRARTQTLGVIIPNVANPFYTALFEGIEEEAQKHGYTVTLGITHYDARLLLKYLDILSSRQMDGIIIDGYSTYCGEEMLGSIDVPVVVIEPPAGFTRCSTIQIDNVAAAQNAVEYLIQRGHRRIAIIAPSITEARFIGYKQALEKHGIPLDLNLVYEYYTFQPDLIAQGYKAMQTLLDRASFTACFIASDIFAIVALKATKESGKRIPEDLAVIGFDDIPFAALTDPPLTTVAQSQRKMGQLAVDMLLKQIGHVRPPQHIVVQHELVVRGST